ncbi:hypothetical protein [Paraflavitalea sp. CAU 1676]|uniref:hypothetical protein n=1 Tax=Paraflavitalea sp. CAU 1676 TaxID=3032598 RepID=UPI0023DBE625|nr:hypothetical protein [Paraflavitalea sp. CAU 1676]MDF2193452.1 hypothetical protein [Paraflavitalea sp. CAU 1676]
MGLFDFFKKTTDNTGSNLAASLIPKTCPIEIPADIENEIDKINWTGYHTAYGSATNTIPFYLKNLFCADNKISMDATHQLWCSLCHQHVYISTAALPSYDILKIGLTKLDNKLRIEILDIIRGFSTCTSDKYYTATNHTPADWERALKQKLLADLKLFQKLTNHPNSEISAFATDIVDDLTNAD